MKIFTMLLIVSSLSSLYAKSYLFKVKEYDQPHMLELTMSEDHTKVEYFRIYDSRDEKTIFEIKAKDSFKISDYDMDSEKMGSTSITLEDTVKNLTCVDELPSNPWGDSEILRDYTYAIYIKLEITNDLVVGGRLEIANNEMDEMTMWGDLVL